MTFLVLSRIVSLGDYSNDLREYKYIFFMLAQIRSLNLIGIFKVS